MGFPKSLIVAIAVGVIASSLLGVLFIELKKGSDVTSIILKEIGYNDTNSVISLSIITDKINYKIDEPINIDIINTGNIPLTFPDTSFGLEIRGLDTTLIYSLSDDAEAMKDMMMTTMATSKIMDDDNENITSADTITLFPDDKATIIWDQIKNDGNSAVQGIYKIYAKAATFDGISIERTTNIEIFK